MATRQRQEIVGAQAGLGAAVAIESQGELGEVEAIRARGYWEQVWLRFRRDKLAIVSGFVVFLLILIAVIGGPIAEHYLHHGPNDIFINAGAGHISNGAIGVPAGPWTTITDDFGHKQLLVLGGDGELGRDVFLRLLYGARVSLEVAIMATFGAMLIGVVLGVMAGYYRGWIDTTISRVLELTMVFPALLFIIALSATIGPRLNDVTLGITYPGVITLVLVFTLFGWFYPARIMRAQVLSLREKEFVEAARMIGASDSRIMRSHVLPHLVAPIIVYSTLTIATYVLAEAGLSFLGLGIQSSTASWGNLLSAAPRFYLTQPWLMVWPGVAVLITTLSFNLLGDGLRDAFDPRSSH